MHNQRSRASRALENAQKLLSGQRTVLASTPNSSKNQDMDGLDEYLASLNPRQAVKEINWVEVDSAADEKSRPAHQSGHQAIVTQHPKRFVKPSSKYLKTNAAVPSSNVLPSTESVEPESDSSVSVDDVFTPRFLSKHNEHISSLRIGGDDNDQDDANDGGDDDGGWFKSIGLQSVDELLDFHDDSEGDGSPLKSILSSTPRPTTPKSRSHVRLSISELDLKNVLDSDSDEIIHTERSSGRRKSRSIETSDQQQRKNGSKDSGDSNILSERSIVQRKKSATRNIERHRNNRVTDNDECKIQNRLTMLTQISDDNSSVYADRSGRKVRRESNRQSETDSLSSISSDHTSSVETGTFEAPVSEKSCHKREKLSQRGSLSKLLRLPNEQNAVLTTPRSDMLSTSDNYSTFSSDFESVSITPSDENGKMNSKQLRKRHVEVQTSTEISWNMHISQPSPIVRYAISEQALNAASAYNPSLALMNELLRSQLRLTCDFMQLLQQMQRMQRQSVFKYTTFHETKKYIEDNKKKIISYEEALKEVEEEMGINQ